MGFLCPSGFTQFMSAISAVLRHQHRVTRMAPSNINHEPFCALFNTHTRPYLGSMFNFLGSASSWAMMLLLMMMMMTTGTILVRIISYSDYQRHWTMCIRLYSQCFLRILDHVPGLGIVFNCGGCVVVQSGSPWLIGGRAFGPGERWRWESPQKGTANIIWKSPRRRDPFCSFKVPSLIFQEKDLPSLHFWVPAIGFRGCAAFHWISSSFFPL